MPGRWVVMGVSGSGKSTVAAALAERMRAPYVDADDLHQEENRAKMAAGEPLDDQDRRPWLDRVGAWLAARPDGAVTACSALKRSYRDQLRGHADGVAFVLLHGSPELVRERQANRQGHFMPGSLLSSQFAALEPLAPDEHGLTVDIIDDVETIVGQVLAWSRLS